MLPTVLALAACFPAGAPEAVRQEMAWLEGEWSMVAGRRDGRAMPEDLVKESRRVARAGETIVTVGGALFFRARYTIDPASRPKAIDYRLTDGPNKGKTLLGIYELHGDAVRFCFARAGQPRPGDFTARKGSGRTFSEWKRAGK